MTQEQGKKEAALICGLIMPISAIDQCNDDHWAEVKKIITQAVEGIPNPKFSVKLVSEADDVGVIQKRIVQNVYMSDIIVCDVSGKNPNVMFELGLRLAFDKPTVIVKDDKTPYAFDTGIIEHVQYPRDLRFTKIEEFKIALAAKIVGTYKAASSDPEYSPFLKNFGRFQVASLSETGMASDKEIRRRNEEIVKLLEDIVQRAQLDVNEKMGFFQKFREQQAELLNAKRELDNLKSELKVQEQIRKSMSRNDPLGVWLSRTIKGNPGYILSASRKDLEVLVKNTFAEEKSSAFLKNAKNLGVVDDKLDLTTRGFNTLIAAAKALLADTEESYKAPGAALQSGQDKDDK
jgi:hypothetical protein